MAPGSPMISVIVVSYNTRDLLLDCLRTLYACTEAEIEVIVVDNASRDGSPDAVEREFPDVRVLRQPENTGFGRANNAGLQQASGRFILLLNSDVTVKEGAVDRMSDFLLLHPEAGAVGPKLVRPDGRLDLACRRGFPTPSASFYRMSGLSKLFPGSRRFNQYNLGHLANGELHEIDAGTAACLMVRLAAVDQVGLFDPDFFMYGEDLDLCFRLKEGGWKIFYMPAAEAIHIKGASSRQQTSRMLFAFHSAMWTFHYKHYAADLSAFGNGLIWASIWGRWAYLRTRAALTHDPRVSV